MADAFVVDNEPERIGSRSLFDMSMDKLRKNIHLLWETNDTPIHILMPLITLVQNPAQLGAIEESSPHLHGHLGIFWLRIIKRNITGWEDMLIKNKLHSDGRHWTEEEVAKKATYRTYRNCVRKMKQEDAAAEEQLRQAVGQASAAQRDKETLIIEQLPPGYLKKKKRVAGGGYDGTSGAAQTGELRFGGGSRTRTNTGKGVMTKIRRELKEARFSRNGGSLATPTHLLQEKAKFMPQGVDRRFEEPQTNKSRNAFRLTARPLAIAPTVRLGAITAAPHVSTTTTSLKTRLPASNTTSPAAPRQSLKRSRPAADEANDEYSRSPSKRNSPPALPPRPPPMQRKRPPPTVLMPARRKR
jgi:hypothetical protein